MVKYVCGGFGYNGFVTKAQSLPMDSYYKTNVISSVNHPRSNSIMLLVLYTVAMQYPGHWYCTTSHSG
jgi:hypothetical protein